MFFTGLTEFIQKNPSFFGVIALLIVIKMLVKYLTHKDKVIGESLDKVASVMGQITGLIRSLNDQLDRLRRGS